VAEAGSADHRRADSRGAETTGLDAARLDVRFAGYCVYCDRLVERMPDGSCPEGHPAEGVSGRIVLVDDDPVPSLPRFNIAAFVLPIIWGPANGQWVGAVFLPIWLFMDSIIATANTGGIPTQIAAPIVVVLTLSFQAFFAKRANGVAFRRVCDKLTVDQFKRQQLIWAIASVPAAAALLGWAIWYQVAVAPTVIR
jgi:hypothetical protein